MPKTDPNSGGVRLECGGELTFSTVSAWEREAQQILKQVKAGDRVILDLTGCEKMDSAGVAFCLNLKRRIAQKDCLFEVLPPKGGQASEVLQVFRIKKPKAVEKEKEGFLEHAGFLVYAFANACLEMLTLFVDTLYYTVKGAFSKKTPVRWAHVVEQMVRIGLESLGIIALLSFLVGLTVALQSAYQLRRFGANIYIADLLGVAMTREMGPLMTAILVAGRSGASIAAEISTMVITEEVDALRTMGIHPVRFLVVPRFLGATIMQPLLTVTSDLLGIMGGFVIAVFYLGLGINAFTKELIEALFIKDLLTGLVKSVAFAWIIVFVAAFRGFRVRGGAEGVGLATTASVVQAIFMVIAADAFFSLLFYFGD